MLYLIKMTLCGAGILACVIYMIWLKLKPTERGDCVLKPPGYNRAHLRHRIKRRRRGNETLTKGP